MAKERPEKKEKKERKEKKEKRSETDGVKKSKKDKKDKKDKKSKFFSKPLLLYNETNAPMIVPVEETESSPAPVLPPKEKEDAEKMKFILSKAVDASGKELDVIGGTWTTVDKSTYETFGKYKWAAISHEEAQIMFEPDEELLRDWKA